ncbi:FitA-like ribbon-helix-helix domain-containing protein [Aurantimonas sp. A3-2-R12]|uniref:FitA-like ribbon-helix-helix domain-containing protein n=1 Tax=Aurantimonas sp. A3-2-R12 TaxID=3114362 RepID=UPI002E18A16B|nr:hypothetical protein [Aurantimonas sp. A3-2-R12]
MASLTIRNLDADVKRKLRMRAAELGRSMEEEARTILGASVDGRPAGQGESVEAREARVRRILSLGRKPDRPFDQKTFTDELWDFVE